MDRICGGIGVGSVVVTDDAVKIGAVCDGVFLVGKLVVRHIVKSPGLPEIFSQIREGFGGGVDEDHKAVEVFLVSHVFRQLVNFVFARRSRTGIADKVADGIVYHQNFGSGVDVFCRKVDLFDLKFGSREYFLKALTPAFAVTCRERHNGRFGK